MRSWNLALGDPLNLTLAADARLGPTNYADDQIWRIYLQGGEPPSVTIETTFGLRARSMRLFPRFVRKGIGISSPSDFHQAPRVIRFYPNYVRLDFWPYTGIEVRAEYWIPDSNCVAGRLTFRNQNVTKENFAFEWSGLLTPLEEGEGMSVASIEKSQTLLGTTGNLAPVCLFGTKAAVGHGPFPALAFNLELLPGNSRQLTWAMASLPDAKASYKAARQVLTRNWDAEIARIELQNSSQSLEIETGYPDWDAALAFAQKAAFGLFQSRSEHMAHASFVLARRPDDGFSRRGDGSDYSHLWDGQTALDSYYLASLILPGGSRLAEGLLQNFLSTQNEAGEIDWKPGLSGKTSRRLGQPILATLALEIDQCRSDHAWLAEIYPSLLSFFKTWFTEAHDRDQDAYPEWDHPLQTGLEDNPLYDRWSPDSQGIEIQSLECPALAALLYREAASLEQIASQVGAREDIQWLRDTAAALRSQVEDSWNDENTIYRYRDFRTHRSSDGNTLYRFQGPCSSTLRRSFKTPQRLVLHLAKSNETTRAISIIVTGTNADGEITEEFPPRRWTWLRSHGSTSSQNAFLSITRVECQGLDGDDTLTISRADYTQEDISLLLPLWAGLPDANRASSIVHNCLEKHFMHSAGLPDYLLDENTGLPLEMERVSMLWNHLIGEGLLRYGFRPQAVDLVTRLMEASLSTLCSHGEFRQNYQADSVQPQGERNHLHGLPPLGLFLQIAGIRSIGKDDVITHDFNSFPWPVTVKYQGMTVECLADRTHVTFSNGVSIEVTEAGMHHIHLE